MKTLTLKSLVFASLWIVSIIYATAQSYTFSTLAGTAGVSGRADGTGAAAIFYDPIGVATDNAGNLYVADASNNIIRKIVISTGVVTPFAGKAGVAGTNDGVGIDARFDFPTGITTDGMGNLYVADSGSNIIRKIVISSKVVSTVAGSAAPILTIAGFRGNPDGVGYAAVFADPTGIAYGGKNNDGNVILYVADTWGEAIRRIIIDSVTGLGSVKTVAGGLPGGASNGTNDGVGYTAQFNAPFGVAVDNTTGTSAGTVYVADQHSGLIRKIFFEQGNNGLGTVKTLAGTGVGVETDGPGGMATFNLPTGIAVDNSGNVYVTDTFPHPEIRKITVDGTGMGTVTTVGTNSIGTTLFQDPFGIAVDNSHNLYIANSGNETIEQGMLPPPSCDSPCYVLKAGDTMTGTLNLPPNGLAVGGNQLVANNGNVGIGKSNPVYPLDVNGAINANGITTFDASAPALNFSSPQRHSFILKSEGQNTLSMLSILYSQSDKIPFPTPNPPDKYLASFLKSGSVGIGTTSPDEKLSVSGAIDVMAAAANPNGNTGLGLSFESYGGRIQSFQSLPLILNPLGNAVGIGTTTPKVGFHVQNDTPPGPNIPNAEAVMASGSNWKNGFTSVNGDNEITMHTFDKYCEVSTFNWATHQGLPLILNPNGNNVGIGTTSPKYTLDVAGDINAGGNVFARGVKLTSDRNAKENFTPINAREVLNKVVSLPVTEWNYKTESKDVQHLGPVSQDFQATFGLDGNDDKHISLVDEGGVALAAIQGLNQKVDEKDAQIQNLKQQNDILAKRLDALQQMVQSLSEKK